MAPQSFTKALFQGVVLEEMVFPFPEPSTEDREATRAILNRTRKHFAASIDATAIDRAAELSPEVLEGLKKTGLFGLLIPPPFGGAGLSMHGFGRVMEEIGGLDASIAVTLGAHQSLGVQALLAFGTDEQKRRYLPGLASGEHIAAFAMTEAGTGSDASATRTRADRSSDGKGWVLNGTKVWVTNGGFADVFIVLARTSHHDEGKKPKLTAFLVERVTAGQAGASGAPAATSARGAASSRGEPTSGVRIGPAEGKLGIRGASTVVLTLEGVRVPDENVLGDVGRGFKLAMEVLNAGRLSLATGTVGACKQMIRMAVTRVGERKAFGRSIGEFAMIKDKIATMMADTWALESLAYLTAGLADARNVDYSLESAMCKVLGSETLWRVANETVQIAAGTGYMTAFPYERLLRDARIHMIFEGTNEILRGFVAVSGMHGAGQQLSDLKHAMHNPLKGIGVLSGFARRKARTALGQERLSRVHPRMARETVIFEEHARSLAMTVDRALRKHGKNISEMQNIQRRVFEITLDLLAIVACLSRATRSIERRGEEGARRELDLTSVFTTAADLRIKAQLLALDQNDDDLRRAVAGRAYSDGGYPFDVM